MTFPSFEGIAMCAIFFASFLSRICSYTFQLHTIVRSFSWYIRRAFVPEYPF